MESEDGDMGVPQETLEQWLDLWDAANQRETTPDVDAFVARVCGGDNPELVGEFRRLVGRLQKVDRLIRELGTAGVED